MKLVETYLQSDSELLLQEYSVVRSVFDVNTTYDEVSEEGYSFDDRFVEKPLSSKRQKNYDEIELPISWAKQWDLRNWLMIRSYIDSEYIGGCLVAHDTDGVDMLEGGTDISVLWDIRVSKNHRNCGVGTALFKGALDYSKKKGCTLMKIETQNNNVGACNFYRKQGCMLLSIKKNCYPEFPDEIQLIWGATI